MMWAVLPASLKATSVDWCNKIAISGNPASVHANIHLQQTGELFLYPDERQTNRLDITGDFTGTAGAKIFLGANGFINLSGVANGLTEIIPGMFDDWDGSPIDLVRAKRDGSDADAFYVRETAAACGEYNIHPEHRTEGEYLIWYISGTRIFPLIKQLGNHTLLVNNNSETNGGYKFVYYYWYRDGQILKEGSHEDFGGSYYTGGTSLKPDAEYTVEAIDNAGKRYHSCPYNHIPVELAAKVKVYPNPVNPNTTVYVEVENGGEMLLKNAVPVNVPQTPGGYILKFKAENFETDRKIIVK